ncbi:hypothetical protein, conserved [Plasmodium gonderi]|uniref:Uncharacterized protein n=1 Tax=Plasmodium gonderi TaxID=77519 RepID=A0A1Y1JDA0_PLAGO|nr:hypothetical protein, conserved [Plasmodium gonderi]GAW80220.1 hypothetical protein, conserved [Plasmodium gonderi]
MMKITKERKKYRINNPYDEEQKIAIKAQVEEWKKQNKIEQKEQLISEKRDGYKTTNAAERFMEIYKKHLEKSEEIEKYKKENEHIEESKKKTGSRKKKKKLNFKLKKNNLMAKLVKNKAIIKTGRTHLPLSKQKHEKKKKLSTGIMNKQVKVVTDTYPTPVLEKILNENNVKGKDGEERRAKNVLQNGEVNGGKNGTPNNHHNRKRKEDVLNQYDNIMNTCGFIQNPLEFAKNIIENQQKQIQKRKNKATKMK